MSDAISEGKKEEREAERREFLLNVNKYADKLREYFSEKVNEEKKLHQINHRYERLKNKFLNEGFFVKDDDGLEIYKTL